VEIWWRIVAKGEGGAKKPMLYRLEGCELDGAQFELRRDGRPVPVEPQVLELLLYLVANRDRAVTRNELFEKLWRGRIVSESALNSAVKAARSAIGDDGKSQSRIRTLHRTGYRFVGEVEELHAAAAGAPGSDPRPEPAASAGLPVGSGGGVLDDREVQAARAASGPRSSVTEPSQSAGAGVAAARAAGTAQHARPLPSRLLGLAGAALGVLIAGAAFSLLPRDAKDAGPAAATAVASALPARAASVLANPKSLAVLPFTNLSPDAEQAYFADSVSVELLNVLSRLPDLQVTGRVSAAYFKGRNDTPAAIGETLGVSRLLTGSVRKSGDRVRITVELVDAASGYQLWTDSYDRLLGDIFDVQDDIAQRVATALQVKLGLGESGELGMTRNVAAYDEFLRGVALYTDYRAESFPRAIEHMHRAIALDPGFSRAWAYLYCIHMDGRVAVPERAEEWRGRALEALDRARALTPDAPFVRVLDARNDMHFGRKLEARTVLDSLPAGFWTGDRHLTRDVFRGRFLIGTGHVQEAIESLERARAADPLSPVVALFLGVAHAIDGNAADALAETERGLQLGQLHPLFKANAMLVALGSGDHEQIRHRVAAASLDDPGHRAINDALVQHLDDPAAGRAEVRRIAHATSAPDTLRRLLIAQWAAYYGEPDLALETLHGMTPGAADDGLLWRPVMNDVRKLAGFKDLVRSEGLVDYWRVHGWPSFCRPGEGDDFECA
jgi:TolB-like protein/DNA-binding winged helix-turn-helix (wHTH) protein